MEKNDILNTFGPPDTSFNSFVNGFTKNRQQATLNKQKGKAEYYKYTMNGSYGHDAMNIEKFGKTFIQDKARTRCSIMSNKFKNSRKIGEDCFQVMMHSTSYNCDTCIHEAYFTLDNAKYWYLVFIYEFMYKCLDMDKIHFIEGDTDSMYWAIAGNLEDDFKQGFKHVVKTKNNF